MENKASKLERKTFVDLLWVLGVAIGVTVVSIIFDLFEILVYFFAKSESFELDEIFVITVPVLALGFFWYSLRRLKASQQIMKKLMKEMSQHEQTQNDLIETRTLLEEILNSGSTIFYTRKPLNDFTATYVSRNIKDQLGYDPVEFLENPSFCADRAHPDDSVRLLSANQQLFQNGTHSHEYRFKHNDGTYRWMKDDLKLLFDNQDKPSLIVGYLRDVTKRVQAEQKTNQQSNLLKAINCVLREALTCETPEEIANTCLRMAEKITDSKFGFIALTNSASDFDILAISNPGWSACQMPDSMVTQMIIDSKIKGADKVTSSNDQTYIINNAASNTDLAGFPAEYPMTKPFLCIPFKASGKTIGIIGLGKKDGQYLLIDQKHVEDLSVAFVEALLRKQAERALQAEEEKYRVLVEESPFGVCWISQNGVYQYVNSRFTEMLGYTLADVSVGNEWFDRMCPEPETRKEFIFYWNSNIGESPNDTIKQKSFTLTCNGGLKKEVLVIPVRLKSGEYIMFFQDISKEKKLEAQLAQSQKMEAIGTLAGGVAHDFNNILTTIMGNTEILLMDLKKKDDLRTELTTIMEAGKRAASLTRQLLAFSRKQIIEPKIIDLNEIINNTNKMLRRLIGENVEMKTILHGNLLQIKADPGQIEQVIMNLSVNARDAMPNGGTLTIETDNVNLDKFFERNHGVDIIPGPYVKLVVSDTGIGMDDVIISRIFEPFFTTKEEGKGTGMGLSMIYGIVKQNGGFIWADSKPGQGASFTIYIPALETTAIPTCKTQISVDVLSGEEFILLVEDDEQLRFVVKKSLENYGYKVFEADNGEAALKIFTEHKMNIDLLITDVVMPNMSGGELANHLQKIRPSIKIIYMSGYPDNIINHDGILDPGLDFIQKPFSSGDMVRKVREVLDSPAK